MGDRMTLGQAIDQIVDALNQLEPDGRQTAIQAACSHLGVTLSEVPTRVSVQTALEQTALAAQPQPLGATSTVPGSALRDIRSLKEEKQPSSTAQMACIVAYYLQELAPTRERKDTVKTADIGTYFKQAGYRLPRKLDQVLVDAKGAGYFESVSRGEYRLNTVGYNLVVHNMPKHKAS